MNSSTIFGISTNPTSWSDFVNPWQEEESLPFPFTLPDNPTPSLPTNPEPSNPPTPSPYSIFSPIVACNTNWLSHSLPRLIVIVAGKPGFV